MKLRVLAGVLWTCLAGMGSAGDGRTVPGVVVSELMPGDAALLADEEGDYPGWVELQNRGSTSVDLAGYGLSDEPTAPYRWVFPSMRLEPGESVVVFTSGKDRRVAPQRGLGMGVGGVLPTPRGIAGKQLWLDAADAAAFEIEDGGVARWRDRSGAVPTRPAVTPRSPSSLEGLELWLDAVDADTLTLISDEGEGEGLGADDARPAAPRVSRWGDKSGRGRHATQPAERFQPRFVEGVSDVAGAVRLDGVDDFLRFDRVSTIRTAVLVLREAAEATDTYRPVLGDSVYYDFARGRRRWLLSDFTGNLVAALGRAWLDGEPVNPQTTPAPARLSVLTLQTLGPANADNLGTDRHLSGSYWQGDFAEVLLFDRVLSDLERTGLEAYLRQKHALAPWPLPAAFDAVQAQPERRPRRVEDVLTAQPRVRFDGVDDVLEFPRLGGIQSVYLVFEERPIWPVGCRPLLGDPVFADFQRGERRLLLDRHGALPEVAVAPTWLDGLPVDAPTTRPPFRLTLLKWEIAGGARASNLAWDRAMDDRAWAGDFAEVLLFSRRLSEAEDALVTAYLRGKWQLPASRLHASFKLGPGETLVLTSPEGTRLDAVEVGSLRADLALGRRPGADAWSLFAEPTPGSANLTAARAAAMPPPVLLPGSGVYAEPVTVRCETRGGEGVIRFTLDGSEPDADAPAYAAPVRIEGPAVFRARVFGADAVPSRTVTGHYLVGVTSGVAVASVAAAPADLFGDARGMLVIGTNASPFFAFAGANYWKNWERPAHLALLEPAGQAVFEQDAGVQVHGNWSRTGPQKSLQWKARRRYGAGEFQGALFPGVAVQRFESLVLRNAGNDWSSTRFRDPLFHALIAGTGLDRQGFRPTQVYLNGAYYGLLNLREQLDEHYLAAHRGLAADAIDLIKLDAQILAGDRLAYDVFFANLGRLDPADPAAFAAICSGLDLENVLDYFATQIYADNRDWPQNNTLAWRARGPEGVWRWIPADLDGGFILDSPTRTRDTWSAIASDSPYSPPTQRLYNHLLRSPTFQRRLLNRLADHLNSRFRTEAVVAAVDELEATFAPEIGAHLERWAPWTLWTWTLPESVEAWREDVEDLRRFARLRPDQLREFALTQFGLRGTATLTLNPAPIPGGHVRVNGHLRLAPEALPWSGVYFQGVPVALEAVPQSGFRFAGWYGVPSSESRVEVSLEDDTTVSAVFVPDDEFDPAACLPVPYDLRTGAYAWNRWDAHAPAGTYPPSLVFVESAVKDPGLAAAWEAFYAGPYNATSRSRVRGLGELGVSFLNTSDPGASGGYVAGALLALQTLGQTNLQVSWTAGTLAPNSRPYALRLQYRRGAEGSFRDVLDAQGRPCEYVTSEVVGDFAVLGPVRLPAEAENQPLLQLLWRYYALPSGASGARAELRLDDLLLSSESAAFELSFATLNRTESGLLRATLRLPPGQRCTLLMSSDLVTWQPAAVLLGGYDGTTSVDLALDDDAPQRFYGLRVP